MGDVNYVSAWMMKVHSVKLSREWLQECADWMKENRPSALETKEALRDAIFDQWLISDLKDSAMPCLPKDVKKLENFTGSFAVQMNVIWDIGESFYSQLTRVQGTVSDNVEVCEERVKSEDHRKKNQKSGNHKSHMMELTDGHQVAIAMEFASIPAINVQLQPGVKMTIQGDIKCSMGLLLLTATNLKVIGGEEENLVLANNQESVLKRLIANGGHWGDTKDLVDANRIERNWKPANLASTVFPKLSSGKAKPAVELKDEDFFKDEDDFVFDEQNVDEMEIDWLDVAMEDMEPEDFEDAEPLTLLKDIETGKRPNSLRVHAKVTKLTSTLVHHARTGWKLLVQLDDGTATVNAIMSDPVLGELLGLSGQQARDLKSQPNKAAANARLTECIQRGKEKLQNLHCVMEVDVNESGQVVVTKLREARGNRLRRPSCLHQQAVPVRCRGQVVQSRCRTSRYRVYILYNRYAINQ